MYSFSDNYQLRQYYLQEQHAPAQCVIKRNLAAVLFKFLNPKLKLLAGLEPPLKGGGRDWYVCPKEILVENRAVLKPLAHEILNKINHFGFDHLGFQILLTHHKDLQKEKTDMLQESNNVWKNTFKQEQSMYRRSLSNIEMVFHEGLINDIKTSLKENVLSMKDRYDILCKSQALLITHEATVKLKQEKARLKANFLKNLETCRTEMTNKLDDLNVEKHIAAQKLRTFLEHRKLACQIYVDLKEKEECCKKIEEKNQEHKKYEKHLTKDSALLNLEASLVQQKDKIQQESNSIWLQKVSHVVKNFQMFVSYCLNMLPDQAEFFINMEKLLLLQFSKVLEDPTPENIITVEKEEIKTPVPQPKPIYLFCDRGYKAQVEQDQCTKHSGTPTVSGLPVIVVNKRCLYPACDNFEQFSNKAKEFIQYNCEDDIDIKDDLVDENFVPVKFTTSQQMSEVKIESSLLQILQQKSNIEKVTVAAQDMPHCFGISANDDKKPMKRSEKSSEQEVPLVQSQITNDTEGSSANVSRLEHAREPKLERYLRETEPKVCGCAKSCKKHLVEHLPMYMRKTSKFDTLELANYEACSVTALKKLVKRAKAQRNSSPIVTISSRTKDMSTQYSDEQFDFLCTCFSHNNIDSFEPLRTGNHFSLENVSPSYMTATQSSFAIDRAHSLRHLIEDAPELKQIFDIKEKG